MDSNSIYFILLLTIAVYVTADIRTNTKIISCWQCSSILDPKCGDPFDNTTDYLFKCADRVVEGRRLQAKMCRKTRQKIEGEWRTIRGCAYIGEPGEGTGNENHCLIIDGTYDVYSEYCQCDRRDGCNTANTIRTSLLFAIFIIPIYFVQSWCSRLLHS